MRAAFRFMFAVIYMLSVDLFVFVFALTSFLCSYLHGSKDCQFLFDSTVLDGHFILRMSTHDTCSAIKKNFQTYCENMILEPENQKTNFS